MGTDRFDELVRCEVEWGPLTSNALTVVKPHRFVASTRVTKRHRQTSQTRQCIATATRERTWAQIDCMTSSGWRDFDGSGVRREPRSTVVLSTHLLHPRQMTMRNVEHQACILGRMVTWASEGIEWEADPRHVDLVLEACGVGNTGPSISTPVVKETVDGVASPRSHDQGDKDDDAHLRGAMSAESAIQPP